MNEEDFKETKIESLYSRQTKDREFKNCVDNEIRIGHKNPNA